MSSSNNKCTEQNLKPQNKNLRMGHQFSSLLSESRGLYEMPVSQYSLKAKINSAQSIWKNKAAPYDELMEYKSVVNSQKELQKIYDIFKFRHNHMFLPSTKYLSCQCYGIKGCGEYFKSSMFMQNSIASLSIINDIPFLDSLHIYGVAFKGFQILFRKYGYFEAFEDMFHICQNGKVKVWCNSDLYKIAPEQYLIDALGHEKDMIYKIINIVDENVDKSEHINFKQAIWSYLGSGRYPQTFEQANYILKHLCRQNQWQVPERLRCINQLSREDIQKLLERQKTIQLQGDKKQEIITMKTLNFDENNVHSYGYGNVVNSARAESDQKNPVAINFNNKSSAQLFAAPGKWSLEKQQPNYQMPQIQATVRSRPIIFNQNVQNRHPSQSPNHHYINHQINHTFDPKHISRPQQRTFSHQKNINFPRLQNSKQRIQIRVPLQQQQFRPIQIVRRRLQPPFYRQQQVNLHYLSPTPIAPVRIQNLSQTHVIQRIKSPLYIHQNGKNNKVFVNESGKRMQQQIANTYSQRIKEQHINSIKQLNCVNRQKNHRQVIMSPVKKYITINNTGIELAHHIKTEDKKPQTTEQNTRQKTMQNIQISTQKSLLVEQPAPQILYKFEQRFEQSQTTRKSIQLQDNGSRQKQYQVSSQAETIRVKNPHISPQPRYQQINPALSFERSKQKYTYNSYNNNCFLNQGTTNHYKKNSQDLYFSFSNMVKNSGSSSEKFSKTNSPPAEPHSEDMTRQKQIPKQKIQKVKEIMVDTVVDTLKCQNHHTHRRYETKIDQEIWDDLLKLKAKEASTSKLKIIQ